MSDVAATHATLVEGVAGLGAVSSADDRIAVLGACESLTRRLEFLSIELIAGLDRDGVFAERGYSSSAVAVADLLGCDRVVAARRVRVAEQVCVRVGLDGAVLPARLAATAAAFAGGRVSLRHVEVISDALGSQGAGRLAPEVWAGAEEQLAGYASLYPPRELASLARDLLTYSTRTARGPITTTRRRSTSCTWRVTRRAGVAGSRANSTRRHSTRWPRRWMPSQNRHRMTRGRCRIGRPTRSVRCAGGRWITARSVLPVGSART